MDDEETSWVVLAREITRIVERSNPDALGLLMPPLPTPPPNSHFSAWQLDGARADDGSQPTTMNGDLIEHDDEE